MKKKLIYIYPKKATFIERDLLFLNKKYKVLTQDLDWGSPRKLVINFIKQFFFLFNNIFKSEAIIINFGGYFSYLPTILGKLFKIRTFIILNGTDCVSFPKYNYGSLRKGVLKSFIYNSYKNATKLLPVDTSLVLQKYTYIDDVTFKKQGFQFFFPELKTPYKVIPNGFDTTYWNFNIDIVKKGFISVGYVNSIKTFQLKGFDLIIEVAKRLPNQSFTLIGLSDLFKNQLKDIPKNVISIPYLNEDELKKEYQKHQFSLQISLNEGFGCALAESMLCGCIPIVSNVGALPNVIKDAGFKVEKKGSEFLFETLESVLKLKPEQLALLAIKSRENIRDNFDIKIREELILQEIES